MKVLKWVGYILGAIVVVILIALVVAFFISNQKLSQGYMMTPDTVAIPTDEASIAHGKHLAEAVSPCVACHTPNLAGEMFIDEPGFAQIAAPNLTSGKGGVGGHYKDEDWVRALRHGVAADGRQLLFMPSHWFNYMTDQDLGSLIAYIKTVPPADQEWPERKVAFIPTRILLAFGLLPFEPALIAKNGPRVTPTPAASAEYGEYLVRIGVCHDCHGANLAGGEGGGAPAGPNLTQGGEIASWSEEDFLKTIHTGVTPGGKTLSDEMPWKDYSQMTDDELKAVFTYLQTLPALPTNPVQN